MKGQLISFAVATSSLLSPFRPYALQSRALFENRASLDSGVLCQNAGKMPDYDQAVRPLQLLHS